MRCHNAKRVPKRAGPPAHGSLRCCACRGHARRVAAPLAVCLYEQPAPGTRDAWGCSPRPSIIFTVFQTSAAPSRTQRFTHHPPPLFSWATCATEGTWLPRRVPSCQVMGCAWCGMPGSQLVQPTALCLATCMHCYAECRMGVGRRQRPQACPQPLRSPALSQLFLTD